MMLQQTHTREHERNEDTMRGSHNPNERGETEEDMLSELPDCILLHVLSFMNAKQAIQTCLLSTRWKYLWNHLPTLKLVSNTRMGFIKFSRAFNAFNIELLGCADEPHVINGILRYAISQNVNRLHLYWAPTATRPQFPSPLLSCCSLTSLDIMILGSLQFPNSLNLPALTYLKLKSFKNLSFCVGNDGRAEPFSTFNRLNTLILHFCMVQDAKPLCISSTTLLNLSIRTAHAHALTRYSVFELFTPSLCTFAVSCNSFQELSGSHLSSIKQVSIDLYEKPRKYPVESNLGIFNWLIEMTNIESLTVTPKTLQVISLYPDILKLKLTSWSKLKSLKLSLNLDFYSRGNVKMELARGKSWKENAKLREIIKAELKPIYSSILDRMIDFLLQNSPSAKVYILLEKLY